jgi:hypothetical protein
MVSFSNVTFDPCLPSSLHLNTEPVSSVIFHQIPQDKTVKSTPASLRSLLENFEEVRTWLSEHAPCLVPHLDSDGTEVMPPCPLHFKLEDQTSSLFSTAARRRVVSSTENNTTLASGSKVVDRMRREKSKKQPRSAFSAPA